jgi:small subunit ribosomal protein S2
MRHKCVTIDPQPAQLAVVSAARPPLGYDLQANHRPGGDAWMAVPAFDGRRFHPSPAGESALQPERNCMSVVSMRELLEAGVHFGHQTRRWNPKMRRFIFTERGGIYIIDLQQTLDLLEEAHAFARNLAERSGSVLFVGTKKQAQTAVEEQAKRVGMPYVNHRWLGGLLTNWRTISARIDRLHELRRLKEEGQLALLPAKERIAMGAEHEKLEENLGGVADMKRQPDAIFIVDLRKEQLAVREARRLGMPVIALVDTNCDPDEADYVIPGNDDAIRACDLIVKAIADGLAAGQQKVTPADFATPEPEQPEEPTIPEGDYEQVSPGEEQVAEAPVPEEVRVDG